MLRTLLLAAVAATLAAVPLAAQSDRLPERPRLAADADTNDAQAYYDDGLSRLTRQPDRAADAFYWAARLSPTWAEPFYARRAALHLRNKPQLLRYLTQQRAASSKAARSIDSLAAEAMLRKPFFVPRFDRTLIQEAIDFASDGQSYLTRMRTGDAAYDAWLAFSDGRLAEATRLYGDALKRKPKDYELRAPRARAFYLQLQYDSAASELTLLLAEMRRKDEKELVFYYDSKAMLEYSLGRAYFQLASYDSATAALGRALEEDLSFHMAHVSLAEIALVRGDTATALNELSLAAELRGTDAGTRLLYGQALAGAKRHADAAEQFRKAIEHEPFFALPYFHLAEALEAQTKPADAAAQYREFVARAPRTLRERDTARERLARLDAAGGARP